MWSHFCWCIVWRGCRDWTTLSSPYSNYAVPFAGSSSPSWKERPVISLSMEVTPLFQVELPSWLPESILEQLVTYIKEITITEIIFMMEKQERNKQTCRYSNQSQNLSNNVWEHL
jgi:hypothetical protein